MADRRRMLTRQHRRRTNWTYAFSSAPQAVAVAGSLAVTLLDPQLAAQNGTLVRIRGEIAALATSIAGVDGIAAFGIAVLEERAVTAGIAAAAIPRPISEGGDDVWLWHSTCRIDGGSSTEVHVQNDSFCRILVDSKAMRKYVDDVRLVLIAESRTVAFNFTHGLRILSKLP